MSDLKEQPGFLSFLPISLFGSVMAMTGLSYSWGWSEKLFHFPGWIRNLFAACAIIIFVVLSIAYLLKCIKFPALVKSEFEHPVSVSFFGAPIVCLLLLPGIILPYNGTLAIIMWCTGSISMFIFAWIVLRKWLDHQQEPGNALPVWIIPIVGTLDVPIVGYRLPIHGIHEICTVFFGIGLISAIILSTIIISRLLFQPPIPEVLKPTLLILIAPFALAFSCYDSLTGSHDIISSAFLYFGIFLLLVLGSKIFMLPQCCPFRVTWWAVGFPLVAITIAAFRYTAYTSNDIYKIIPGALLAVSTIVSLYLLCQSIYRLATRQFLLPKHENERATRLVEPLVHS